MSAAVYDSTNTVPIPKPSGYFNRNQKFFAILGPFHRRYLSELIVFLLDAPSIYLLLFIFAVVFTLTLLFWPFYALLGPSFTGKTVMSTMDALTTSFAGLFSQATPWTATNSASLFLVTLQSAIGKLTLSALTALLVLKVSRVPNFLIVSKSLLFHRHEGEWHISFRIGTLYNQVLHGVTARLHVNFKDPITNKKRYTLLDFSSNRFNTDFSIQGPMPINLRHLLSESPMSGVDFEKEEDVKACVSNFMLCVQGFDVSTGRSVGLIERYKWSDDTLKYDRGGAMDDVLVKLSEKEKKRYGKGWGVKFTAFNGVKRTEEMV